MLPLYLGYSIYAQYNNLLGLYNLVLEVPNSFGLVVNFVPSIMKLVPQELNVGIGRAGPILEMCLENLIIRNYLENIIEVLP